MRRNKGIGIDRNLYILARFIEKIQFERLQETIFILIYSKNINLEIFEILNNTSEFKTPINFKNSEYFYYKIILFYQFRLPS